MAAGQDARREAVAVRLKAISVLFKFLATATLIWSVVDYFVRLDDAPSPHLLYLVAGILVSAVLWIAALVMDGFSRH